MVHTNLIGWASQFGDKAEQGRERLRLPQPLSGVEFVVVGKSPKHEVEDI